MQFITETVIESMKPSASYFTTRTCDQGTSSLIPEGLFTWKRRKTYLSKVWLWLPPADVKKMWDDQQSP